VPVLAWNALMLVFGLLQKESPMRMLLLHVLRRVWHAQMNVISMITFIAENVRKYVANVKMLATMHIDSRISPINRNDFIF
jgi:hypothetical protein